jgi:NADH:quinone reductase (non-electrogenic)
VYGEYNHKNNLKEREHMKTRVTEIFGIKYPIVQGGLAYLAYAELAAAVSNAGGLGQITAATLGTPEKLQEEILKVRALTNKPFGVNFAIAKHDNGGKYQELLEVAIDEKVPVISLTGANPQPVFERIKGVNIRTLVLVAGVRQAQKAEELGADAVMAVGKEGGGHLGRDDISTMVLIPRVVDSVSIPVLASGGIGDGRGLLAALS